MDISLALGGGGSRGYAHVGVLRCLLAEGFRIRAIAGTSAGGIVAAAFAAGYSPDEMEAVFSKIDQSKLFARSPADGPGILGPSSSQHRAVRPGRPDVAGERKSCAAGSGTRPHACQPLPAAARESCGGGHRTAPSQ